MGRGATVAAGNVWYEARMEAAKVNEKLSSRFGAASEAGMSEDSLKNTELGLEKRMPVEKAITLADTYRAPQLLNWYCLHECPIGKNRPISDEVESIERVTVKLLKRLKPDKVESIKDRLVEIAEDGTISEDELNDFDAIVKYLDELSKTISELRTISECLDPRSQSE